MEINNSVDMEIGIEVSSTHNFFFPNSAGDHQYQVGIEVFVT